MREKQELLKREGEREASGGLSIYTRWGGVIRDDGNIKSGQCVRSQRRVCVREESGDHSHVCRITELE